MLALQPINYYFEGMSNLKSKLFLITMLALGGIFFSGHKVEAATLTVSSGCTLTKAINSVNGAADQTGCTASGSYGSNDTINLPTGTTTLSADLPAMTKSAKIIGAGKSATTLNVGANLGFNANLTSQKYASDFTISNMTITNAAPFAIKIAYAKNVVLDQLDVNNSHRGITLPYTESVAASNIEIHDNTDTDLTEGNASGLDARTGSETSSVIPSFVASNIKVYNNTGMGAGVRATLNTATDTSHTAFSQTKVEMHNIVIQNNQTEAGAGVFVVEAGGPTATVPIDLTIDATTVANNTVTVTQPQASPSPGYNPVLAGFLVTGKLTEQHNFKNVTVAYNTVNNPAPDTRNSFAGFLGSLAYSGAPLSIVNNTIVGNTVTQPNSQLAAIPSFFALRMELNQSFTITNLAVGAKATNTLVAHNSYNGTMGSCWTTINGSLLGYSGTIDGTPVDNGHNMSDDQTCTGYTYVPTLYDTIDHEVKDNGGPVPTIALHDNSPAVDGGGQVLGITTDARGVARSGYYSVGAYQGTILASSTTNVVTAGSQLAKTGVFIALASPIGLFLIGATLYTYLDYRKHKTPLTEASSDVNYSYFHHLKVVSLPLAKYRLSIGVDRQVGDRSDRVRRF